jgi:hypothetical protein
MNPVLTCIDIINLELESFSGSQAQALNNEVDAFYWTVLAPDIVNPGREEQGSFSV